MTSSKRLLLIFVPALFLVFIALLIRVNQYEPLFPDFEAYQAQQEERNKFAIPILPEDPIIGAPNAQKTIIAFEDFGCESCAAQSTLFAQLIQRHPDKVKIIWKGLPVTRFPYNSRNAHLIAVCMRRIDRFEDFADHAFANREDLSSEVLDTIIKEIGVAPENIQACIQTGEPELHVQKTEDLAAVLDVQSVPAVFIDNKQIQPQTSVEDWERVLGL